MEPKITIQDLGDTLILAQPMENSRTRNMEVFMGKDSLGQSPMTVDIRSGKFGQMDFFSLNKEALTSLLAFINRNLKETSDDEG